MSPIYSMKFHIAKRIGSCNLFIIDAVGGDHVEGVVTRIGDALGLAVDELVDVQEVVREPQVEPFLAGGLLANTLRELPGFVPELLFVGKSVLARGVQVPPELILL